MPVSRGTCTNTFRPSAWNRAAALVAAFCPTPLASLSAQIWTVRTSSGAITLANPPADTVDHTA